MNFDEKPQEPMDFRKLLSELFHKVRKETLILLLCFGLLLMILAIPSGGSPGLKKAGAGTGTGVGAGTGSGAGAGASAGAGNTAEASQNGDTLSLVDSYDRAYEQELENRVKNLLQHVEGVGETDVMIMLESSKEAGSGAEQTSPGTEADSGLFSESSLWNSAEASAGSENGSGFRPAVSGMVISAQGGGSPATQAKIVAAMSALFHLSESRIQVLKRGS